MVDRSEFAWRMLTRSFMPGADGTDKHGRPVLAYSPMFHARLFRETEGYRAQHFEAVRRVDGNGEEKEVPYLDGNPSMDRPLIVQFCANDPADLLDAARRVQGYCDAVDLNLGCPQGIAKRGHYGAFLQEDWGLIWRLIRTLRDGLDVPVTAKFRIQESKEKTLEYARMILDAGASVITVHGRRREQKGHNTGLADWAYIRYLREKLPADTVIFANGNVLNHADVQRCLEETGADAVMSAEGNLSDPTIFAGPPDPKLLETDDGRRMYWVGRDGRGGYRMDFVLRRYLDIIHEYVLEQGKPVRPPLYIPGDPPRAPPEPEQKPQGDTEHPDEPPKKKLKRSKTRQKYNKPTSPNLTVIQGHLFQLLRPLISHHTYIRDALARSKAGDIPAFENVLSMVERVVEEGIRYYEDPESEEARAFDQMEMDGDGLSEVEKTRRRVRRPWWVCQPYVRPAPEEAAGKGALREKKDKSKEKEKEKDRKEMKDDGCADGCAESGKENVEPEPESEAKDAGVEKAG